MVVETVFFNVSVNEGILPKNVVLKIERLCGKKA